MRPVLLAWRGLRVHSYPALLYLGVVLGVVAGHAACEAGGVPAGRGYVALVLLTVPAFVGSRLLYVATLWRTYAREPRRILASTEGGMAMLGGLPLALLVSVPLLAALGLPFLAFWDAATFTLLVGMTFARVGCLLNGCCSGRATEGRFGVELPDHRGVRRRRVPTQALEGLLGAAILAGAVAFHPHRPFPGAVLLAALAAYSLGRFLLEPLRATRYRLGRVDVHRALAAGLAVLAGGGFLGGLLAAGP